jgi:hypothetical protein
VFLVQRAESWINVHRLWVLMQEDDRFSTEVRVISHDDDASETLRKREACIAQLKASGVVVDETASDTPRPLESGQFDVAIFNAPYERERVPAFHFDRVARQVALTVYVPYGLVMGAGRRNRHYQYAQRTQRDAGLVIARSEIERSMYARYCPTGADHVAVTGLPRLDEMYDLQRFQVDVALTHAIAGRFAVLWNSHFSFGLAFSDGANYSTFDTLVEPLFSYAARHPAIALVWRPHPTLFRILVQEGIFAPNELDAFRTEVAAAGIILDERPDHRHAFAASNMLITDLGSFLVEYLTTNKPLVYLHAADGEGLNEEGQALLEYIDAAHSAADAIALVESYATGADPKRLSRLLARERFLPMFDGKASQRVAERILMTALPAASIDPIQGPRLYRLFAGLHVLRKKKASRGRHAPLPRRALTLLRLELVEWVKRHPRILRLLERNGRRR